MIVDTNREKTSTWSYLDSVLNPALKPLGITIQRIDSSQFKTVDIWSLNDESVLLPVFSNQSGDLSKLPAYCSVEWKRRVAERWLRSQGVEQADNWLGISRDEMSRVRAPRAQWIQDRYPLIFDVPMARQDCIALVQEMGWPEAPRSSCWMCPNMRDREWLDMKTKNPEDFENAVKLESVLGMTTEEIVRLLSAKKTGKRRWIAKCPAHPDKKPSLAITEGRKGILLKCQSHGCDLRDITSNIGLRVRDLFYMERDRSSEQLRALSRQRRIDSLYTLEKKRQDYRMVYRAMKRPPEILLYSHIQDGFTKKIEAYTASLQ